MNATAFRTRDTAVNAATDLKDEGVRLKLNAVENQKLRIGKDGSRMACGRCHRKNSLEHF
jgi:hypothetical protein